MRDRLLGRLKHRWPLRIGQVAEDEKQMTEIINMQVIGDVGCRLSAVGCRLQ